MTPQGLQLPPVDDLIIRDLAREALPVPSGVKLSQRLVASGYRSMVGVSAWADSQISPSRSGRSSPTRSVQRICRWRAALRVTSRSALPMSSWRATRAMPPETRRAPSGSSRACRCAVTTGRDEAYAHRR